NLRLFEDAEERAQRLERLNVSIDRIDKKLFEPELVESVVTGLIEDFRLTVAQVWLVEASDGTLWRRAGDHRAGTPPPLPAHRDPGGQPLLSGHRADGSAGGGQLRAAKGQSA